MWKTIFGNETPWGVSIDLAQLVFLAAGLVTIYLAFQSLSLAALRMRWDSKPLLRILFTHGREGIYCSVLNLQNAPLAGAQNVVVSWSSNANPDEPIRWFNIGWLNAGEGREIQIFKGLPTSEVTYRRESVSYQDYEFKEFDLAVGPPSGTFAPETASWQYHNAVKRAASTRSVRLSLRRFGGARYLQLSLVATGCFASGLVAGALLCR